MKYVLDSSVAAKWVLPETDSDKALRLRDDFTRAVHQLIAPEVLAIEVAHALTRAERQGRIQVGEAAVHWGNVLSTPPKFARSALLLPRAPHLLRYAGRRLRLPLHRLSRAAQVPVRNR